jgi:hypothetical protein
MSQIRRCSDASHPIRKLSNLACTRCFDHVGHAALNAVDVSLITSACSIRFAPFLRVDVINEICAAAVSLTINACKHTLAAGKRIAMLSQACRQRCDVKMLEM